MRLISCIDTIDFPDLDSNVRSKPQSLFCLNSDLGRNDQLPVQPIAFGECFLHSQISIDDLVLRVSLPRSVEKRPRRFTLEIEIE